MKTNPDDQAFAFACSCGVKNDGLTKREYFTAQAMHGLLAGDTERRELHTTIAREAVDQANAMIAELNKEDSDR